VTHLAWFADPEDLRYRIRRLQAPPARSARSALSLGLASAIMTGGLAVAACQLLHVGAAWSGLIPCLAAFGYLGWRPAWARTGRGLVPAPGGGGLSTCPGGVRRRALRPGSAHGLRYRRGP